GPGHVGTDLLVTDERRFPVAQLMDRGFPDVVQQRRQSRNQLRRSEGRGEQRVAEDVVAVPAPLLHPLTGLELWQDAREEAGRIEQLQSALRLFRDQQFRKLVTDPLHRDRRRLEPSRLLANRAFDRRIEREPKGCREADRAPPADRAVPKRSNTTGGCRFNAALTAVAKSIAPCPSTRMSTSRICFSRSPPSRRSRT